MKVKANQRDVESGTLEKRHNQMEQVLRYSEHCFEKLFEFAPDGIYITDLKGNFVDGNKMAVQLIGYPRDELIGKSFLKTNVLPKKQIPKAAALLDKNALGQSTGPDEFILNRKDGSQITVEIRTYPIKSKDKTLVLNIARDITEHKQAEEALKEREEHFRLFFENLPEYCYMISAEGLILDINRAALEILGYEKNEIVGKSLTMVYAPESQIQFKRNFSEWQEKGSLRDKEMVIITKWEERRYVLLSADAIRDANGKIIQSVSVQKDISDRKRAEEALLKEKAKAAQYLEIAGVMFVVIDRNQEVSLVNKKGCQILGYGAEDIIGKNWFDNYLPERHREEVKAVFNKSMNGDIEQVEYYENPILTSSGDERIIAWHNTLLKDEQDNIIGTLSSGEDVTERRKAEESLADEATRRHILVEQSSDGIVILDQDGNVYESNQKFADMLGYPLEAMRQLNVLDWEYLHQPEQTLEMLHSADEKGDHFETKHRRKDGSTYDVEISTNAAMFSGQKLIFCVCRDITERKRNELLLRESEMKHRELLDQLPQIVCEIDTEGKVLFINSNALSAFGYTTNDLGSGITIWQIIEPKDFARAKKNMLKVINGQDIGGVEYTLRRKNGSNLRTLIYSNRIVKNEKPAGIRLIGVDVTERNKMREMLQTSENRFRSIVETTKEWIWIMDLNGKMTYNNPSVKEILGYDPEELFGQYTMDYMHEEDRHRIELMLPELIAEKLGWTNLVVRWWHKDGTLRWLESNAIPILGSRGRLLGYQGADRDITTRIKAEEQLARSEHRFRSVFENAVDGMALLDRDGTFIDCNVKTEEIWGYSREKVLEMKPWEFSPLQQPDGRDSKEKAFELLEAAYQGKPQLFEWVHIRPDGFLVNVEINLSCIELEGEFAVLAIIRDITEQKQAQKERALNTQKLLNAMDATIEAMAMTVEMRDPYTAGHQRRVTELAVAIAKEMDLSGEIIQGINMASIVHDLGKIQIPSEILIKPGCLTDLEFGMIKRHPSAGYEILKNIDFPWPVAKIVLQHHEKMDGSGYPNGISGEDILLEARIICVADVVEAMVSHRPYRPALGIETALEEITQNKGILYDNKVVDACLKLFKKKGFKLKDV
jgi:PAS domain S-box-containing protein